MNRWLRALVVGALVASATFTLPDRARAEEPAPAEAQAGLEGLFAEFGKSPGLFAKFREERTIALLSAPLKSEGSLYFDRAHGLARHTEKPSKKSVLLTSTALSFWDGKRSESVPLGSAPGLKAFADGFRMILAADHEGLQQNFVMAFEGNARARWKLTLTPREASLKKVVSAIELTGNKLELDKLVVKEANGDVTSSEFFEVDTTKKYGEAEAKKVFRVPPQLP